MIECNEVSTATSGNRSQSNSDSVNTTMDSTQNNTIVLCSEIVDDGVTDTPHDDGRTGTVKKKVVNNKCPK